jgi:hypothetical protein
LIRVSLGAHAADALAPDERVRVDEHLASCPDCRRELAELQDVSALLADLPLAQVERLGLLAGDDLQRPRRGRGRLKRPRLRRWAAVVGAAAAIIVLVVAVAALGAGGPTPSQPRSVIATGRNDKLRVSARATLQQRAWGTTAMLRLRGVRPHLRCRLLIVARDGTSDIAATWRANYEGAADVTGQSPIRMSAIAALQVVTDRNQPLVRLPIVRTRTTT